MLDEQLIKFLALQRIHQLFPPKAQSLASSVNSHQQSPVGNHIEGKTSPRIAGLCWAIDLPPPCLFLEGDFPLLLLSDAAFDFSFFSSPCSGYPLTRNSIRILYLIIYKFEQCEYFQCLQFFCWKCLVKLCFIHLTIRKRWEGSSQVLGGFSLHFYFWDGQEKCGNSCSLFLEELLVIQAQEHRIYVWHCHCLFRMSLSNWNHHYIRLMPVNGKQLEFLLEISRFPSLALFISIGITWNCSVSVASRSSACSQSV